MAEVDLSEFMSVTKRSCKVRNLMERLPDDQREKVLAALKAPHITTAAVVSKLSEWAGEKVSYSTVDAHRKGVCSCD